MYDGEGSLYARITTGGSIAQLAIAQNEGLVLTKITDTIKSLGFISGSLQPNGRKCFQTRLVGGVPEVVKFLGTIRPTRLLDKFYPELLGKVTCEDSRNDKVVSIIKLGNQSIVRIAIDVKTMIVEGYGHHNCYEHDEDYLGPQGNHYWRGVWMLHNVNDGEYDEMPVPLDYLKAKYA
jgi:hypothetical protein